MRVCLFVSSDCSQTVLEESLNCYTEKITYLAYMSHGYSGGADACTKAFAMDAGIQSCPFICSTFEQLAGMGALFDLCIVLRRNDDVSLAKLSLGLASVFGKVEEICYNPVVVSLKNKILPRKLSTIVEE